jgi:hypothetical protein
MSVEIKTQPTSTAQVINTYYNDIENARINWYWLRY